MKTIAFTVDDDLDTALQAVSVEQGRAKVDIITDVVRRDVEAENLRRALNDPALATLYQELMDQDVSLAEEGLAEYGHLLRNADIP